MEEIAKTASGAASLASTVATSHSEHEKLCTSRQGAIIKELGEVKAVLMWAIRALLAGAGVVLYDILKAKGFF